MSNDLKERFEELSEDVKDLTSESIKLYLITRNVKGGVPKSRKMLDKFSFKALQIDLNDDLQKYFLEILQTQLEYTKQNADIEFKEYVVIDDNLDNKIYTYGLNNVKSFEDIIQNQLQAGVDVPYVRNLKDIKDSLWAYSISIEYANGTKKALTFRKTSGGKVVTDEKSLWKGFVCAFDSNDSKLEILDKETINFDKKIDCIFLNGQFYVINKNGFETIVGLDEAFHDNAVEVIDTLRQTNIIKGLDLVLAEADKDKTLLKKLASLAKNNNHKNLSEARIEKMKNIASALKLNLKINGNQLLIEDKTDMQLVLRMLDQYYLECMQTGEHFGSHAKKRLAST